MDKLEIRISGSGGQGILMMGIIIAEASIANGNNAIQSQSYGPEARGGASKCEVIIDNNEIYFPKVKSPDFLIALTQTAADKYINDITPDTIVILDKDVALSNQIENKVYTLPIIDTAINVIKRRITGNIVCLGAFYEMTKFTDLEVLKSTILKRIPEGHEDINMEAFEAGRNLIKEVN